MVKRMLFVDDEDWSVTPYFAKLNDAGVKVDLAKDGDEAFERLQKGKYDLIVLDVMLPPGNKIGKQVEPRKAGGILLEMIRKNQIPNMQTAPNVPVAILTAVTDQKLADIVKELEVREVFEKPALFDEVTGKLMRLLNIDSKGQL
jgi:CheY-like chemotaxis protein